MKTVLSMMIIVMVISIWIWSKFSEDKTISAYKEPSLIEMTNSILNKQDPHTHRSIKGIRGEIEALSHAFHNYDLDEPAHKTDGWSNFTDAEWPFMAMAYSGFAFCTLPRVYPELYDRCREEVLWILDSVKRPAISGFVEDHFGSPFPASGQPREYGVFVHGHIFYLNMLARKYLKIYSNDAWLHETAKGFIRDYEEQIIRPSYKAMHYLSDNGSALAALACYDQEFGLQMSIKVREKFVSECKRYYLQAKTGLICTYVNPKMHQQHSGPRGTGVMYLGQFLPEIDPVFAKEQWQAAHLWMIRGLDQWSLKYLEIGPSWLTPMAQMIPHHFICVEHPDDPDVPFESRQWGDTDSGPVVLGVGTSASAFLISAAVQNGDLKTAQSALALAEKMAGYEWMGNRKVARHLFHEVGQAVLLWGRSLVMVDESLLGAQDEQ